MNNADPTADVAEARADRRASSEELMKDWSLSADGQTLTRTLSLDDPRGASKLVSRLVASSHKSGVPLDIHCEGGSVTLILHNGGAARQPRGVLDRKLRGVLRRVDRHLNPRAEEGDTPRK